MVALFVELKTFYIYQLIAKNHDQQLNRNFCGQ